MNGPLDTNGTIDTARSEASRARILTILERLEAMGRRLSVHPASIAERSDAQIDSDAAGIAVVAEQRASAWAEAVHRKDVKAITRLLYWGASTDKNRAAVTSFITHDVANRIRGVAVKPLDPKEPTQYTQDGVTYRMTLTATAKLVITFLPRTEGGATYDSEQTSYFIGVWNGEYWLVTAEPMRANPDSSMPLADETG